jgi:hypothetical protein
MVQTHTQKNRIRGNIFQFLYVKRQKKEEIRITQKKSYDNIILRCSKKLDCIIDQKRKKPIKTKNRTLADIEPKLHGISINQPKFYMTAPC